ncbi:GTP-binding protein 1 [Dinochytrium kinnereticum]|nr:GTP-binding protein 1 [Dinochytrium kinnereticum]
MEVNDEGPFSAVALAQQLATVSIDTEKDDSQTLFETLDGIGEKNLAAPHQKKLYVNPDASDIETLLKYVQSRLRQGQGETVIELGVEEDGTSMNLTEEDYKAALATLEIVSGKLKSDVTTLHERRTLVLSTSSQNDAEEVPTSGSQAQSPFWFSHVLVRQRPGQVEDLLELRIAVVGNVDAGKSTLLGVLTKDVLDDGRGKARVNLFRHKHEMETGRTSSVGFEIMGFNSKGSILTPTSIGRPKLTWDDICVNASKVLTFIDLAGHEKYLKTTVFGMTGCAPDFVMLMVGVQLKVQKLILKIGSNAGVIGMTKEHLGLALALQVPVYIVVTKIDMCPANVLESTLKQLSKILKSSGCRKIPIFVKTVGDVIVTASNFVSERICPIFQVSNITGEGLDLLKMFLNILHANSQGRYDADKPVEFQITDTFSVPGVGTVVSGTIISGLLHVGDSLLLGPDSTGNFTPTIIKSIQRKRVNVPCASAGQSASFALKKIKRSSIRKGMVMLSKSLNPRAVYEFEAEILVLYHSTTIGAKYQAMLHCGCVRQTAKIIGMDKQVLRTGDRSVVRFRLGRVYFSEKNSMFFANPRLSVLKLLNFKPLFRHASTTTSNSGSMSLFDIALKEASDSQAAIKAPAGEPRTFTFKTADFRISPWKTNLVAKVIRRLPLPEAIIQMKFSKKRAGTKVLSLLNRAAASLEHNHGSVRNRWIVKECWVGKGSYLKRLLIQGRGRTGIMHHPSSHVKVVLQELPESRLTESVDHKASRLEMEKLM